MTGDKKPPGLEDHSMSDQQRADMLKQREKRQTLLLETVFAFTEGMEEFRPKAISKLEIVVDGQFFDSMIMALPINNFQGGVYIDGILEIYGLRFRRR